MSTKILIFISVIVCLLSGCQYLPKSLGGTSGPSALPTPSQTATNGRGPLPTSGPSDGSQIQLPVEGSRGPLEDARPPLDSSISPLESGRAPLPIEPRSQSTSWEARWEGTLNSRFPIEMRLRRAGPNLTGTVSYKGAQSRSFKASGQIDSQNGFTLRESSGAVWRGRFQSASAIEGSRPNGPVNDPNAPQWPFSLRRAESYSPGSIPLGSAGAARSGGAISSGGNLPSVTAPTPVSDGFDAFFAVFKTAVQRRDRATLQPLMSPNFSYGNDQNVTPSLVFRELDLADGMNWSHLQNAIAGRIGPYRIPGSSQTARVSRYIPPNTRYQVWVMFEQDQSGRWQWSSMTYPGN